MNKNILIIIAILVGISIFLFFTKNSDESFWGGYFPAPFMGQPLTKYGRYAFNAATDAPGWMVDPQAVPINPRFCPKCRSYRCYCGIESA